MTATRAAAPSPAQFRARFPVLREQVHLASCSLGARSGALAAALDRMVGMLDAGAGAWTDFEREADRCRRGFAALIGADAEQVALVPNASTGAFQVISTLSLAERDVIVTSAEEFPSIAHVWLAQRRRGARVRFVDSFEAAIDRRTALVSVPLVTYARGGMLPVAEIAEAARAAGAPVFVDAYQAAGVLSVDVEELNCDYLVAGAQKYMLGLPGIAFLYVRAGTEARAGAHRMARARRPARLRSADAGLPALGAALRDGDRGGAGALRRERRDEPAGAAGSARGRAARGGAHRPSRGPAELTRRARRAP